jgi:hypothetical protein
MRARAFLTAAALLAVAAGLPALAQQQQQQAPPTASAPAVQPTVTPVATSTPTPTTSQPRPVRRAAPRPDLGAETDLLEVADVELPLPPPPVEIPDEARRDPSLAGALDPLARGLGTSPWGDSNGAFLSTLMRRTEAPIASRWAHIGLRNALLARVQAPRNVNPVDWTAERAWLLLRMGEADAARMLVASVDVDRFTPKMFQVAVQSALASADPPALCPLFEGIPRVEERVWPMVQAMCASLTGEPESASAQVEAIRRRRRVSDIDLVLAQKVVGAGAEAGRAATVEWDPVDRLNSWRFGLATATGMVPPDRLLSGAAPRLRAWHARAPLLTPQQRLQSARIATGLGVFSGQSLTDLYALIYDGTDREEVAETDAGQLRLAFIGRGRDVRLAAIRKLLAIGDGPLQEEASRALVARAATRIAPDIAIQQDAPDLIAAMLSGGYDREAARWADVTGDMDDQYGDRAWAMLVLGVADPGGLDLSAGRIEDFIERDSSRGKRRSSLLVAGLAGLGRIDGDTADRLNRRNGLSLAHRTRWTAVIDRAAVLRQPASVLVLTATGFQTPDVRSLPSSHMYHAVAALRRTGQEYIARMVAAEALART